MSGIRTAGVGIALALSTSSALAQPGDAPAARFGRIQSAEPEVIARGQVGVPTGTLLPGAPGAQPAPAGASLGMPKPFPGPNVTEIRGVPAASFSQPMPVGQPVVIGSGVPVGQPIIVGQPTAVVGGPYPAPSVLPGGPVMGSVPYPDVDAPLCTGPLNTLTGPSRLQLRSDLLLWYVRGGSVPALVTASSPAFNGIPGTGDTRTILGETGIGNTYHIGGNFGGVYWFGCRQCWGVDGNVFFLGRNGDQFTATTAGAPLIARPFLNLNQGIPFSQVVGAPGLATGGVMVTNETSMWGADINLRRYLASTPCARLDGFVGFRYLNLSEELSIAESFTRTADSPLSVGVPTALSGTVNDFFRTENHFYGPQIGLTGEVRRGRWFLEGRGSVALGDVIQTAQIFGNQSINHIDGSVTNAAGGLLALPGGNLGTFTKHRFGVVPEVGVKIGLHITPHLRFAVGYNFLYLNSVIRPGDQIDTGLDVTRIPNFPLPGNIQRLPVPRPAPTLRDSDVFAQGISFSLQWTW